ncbi:MAG: hypothetical protein FJY65_07435 [Calditrichaeota bacterium]|nr:hypothetical protein [Calditrichota bacterium]
MHKSIIAAIALSFVLSGVIYAQHNQTAATPKPIVQALEAGNVWTTEDGTAYFTCPVMGSEERVADATSYSDAESVRYYHCYPGCQAPFRADPDKWLKDFVIPGNIASVDSLGYKQFRDPVTKQTALLEENTLSFDYQGRIFFFASDSARKMFSQAPDKYVKP